jgi:hypothetical protein
MFLNFAMKRVYLGESNLVNLRILQACFKGEDSSTASYSISILYLMVV